VTGATPDDLLVLAGFLAGICLLFVIAGAIVDEGGLIDRWDAWRARRRPAAAFTGLAALSTVTLVLPALAHAPGDDGDGRDPAPRQVPTEDLAVLPPVLPADTATPAPADPADVPPRGGAGTSPVAGDHGEGSSATATYGPCEASTFGWGEPLNRHTANGEVFDPDALVVAHRKLPLETVLDVTVDGRTVRATVTDRGPAEWTGRCIDLSRGVWQALGLGRPGVAQATYAEVTP
jgi:hypothetical protein